MCLTARAELLERCDVAAVLRSARSALVPEERLEPDAAHLVGSEVWPSTASAVASSNVTPVIRVRMSMRTGGSPILVDRARRLEIGRLDAVSGDRRPERDDRLEDARRVLARGAYEDVEIVRGARDPVRGEGVRADDDEIAARDQELLDEVGEVSVNVRGRGGRTTRPGIAARE